jgi:hypothetical protein
VYYRDKKVVGVFCCVFVRQQSVGKVIYADQTPKWFYRTYGSILTVIYKLIFVVAFISSVDVLLFHSQNNDS